MTNGRLHRGLLRRAVRAIRADNYVHAQVLRGRQGSETRVADFQTRIAATNTSALSRDRQIVIGDVATQVYVIDAPEGLDLRKGDEVWAAGARYRIIAVDAVPGMQQIIAQHIQ